MQLWSLYECELSFLFYQMVDWVGIIYIYIYESMSRGGWNESAGDNKMKCVKKWEFLYKIFWVSLFEYMTFRVYECVSICACMWFCVYELYNYQVDLSMLCSI